MPLVELKQVEKRYGEVVAVAGISLAIHQGALVTLLGPSGCGKTTTLRMVAGLEAVSAGQIWIDGHDVTGKPPHQRDVAMVFQSYALFPHFSVIENVAYGLVQGGKLTPAAREKAQAALAQVGLADCGDRSPGALSGGQQQRVAVARALVVEPKVLLFDEPLSNLDARLRRHLRDEIRSLQQRLGLTAIYVTHDQEEALAISDEIVLMDKARIAQQGPPAELYELPASVFVAGFMGDANLVDGALGPPNGDLATLQLGSLQLLRPHRGQAGPVKVAIRPEALEPAETGLLAKVVRSAYLGAVREYFFETELGLLHGRLSPRYVFEIGRELRLSLRPEGVVVLP